MTITIKQLQELVELSKEYRGPEEIWFGVDLNEDGMLDYEQHKQYLESVLGIRVVWESPYTTSDTDGVVGVDYFGKLTTRSGISEHKKPGVKIPFFWSSCFCETLEDRSRYLGGLVKSHLLKLTQNAYKFREENDEPTIENDEQE